jgi:hypothetical protein
MNTNETKQMDPLTNSGLALVVTQLFRLIFGGFLMGKDLYEFHDFESAITVLLIYGLIAILTALFLQGRRNGLIGLVALSAILILLQTIYVIAFLAQPTVDPSIHDPIANWWATLLTYVFPLLTIAFAMKVNRET